jgi:hypothetical protein
MRILSVAKGTKEQEMPNRKRHVVGLIATALVAAAAAAPSAQAAGVSPDDRPFYRGPSETLAPTSLGPDDRPFYRGTSETLAPTSLSPDDRSFARSVGDVEPRVVPVQVLVPARGFDWEDGVIGGTFGVALALLGMAILIARHRRTSQLTTA